MAEHIVYQTGFGNEFKTEALPGALPAGQNAPQQVVHGLYTEQLSGTAFTAPRAANRRSWLYRIRPSAMHPVFRHIDAGMWRSAPIQDGTTPPDQLRWKPFSIPQEQADIIDAMITMAVCGDVGQQTGSAIHIYTANKSMTDRVLYNADGEMLFVPQTGALLFRTEMGKLSAAPGEIVVIPRGVRFKVELLEAEARGYVCENYGATFRLPDLGPIGANGLANPRDFEYPVADYEDSEASHRLTAKFQGHLWESALEHSPLDVVAWHGNYAPYKYDLARFNAMNSVSFDHADPSIFTVLTSPSEIAGTANVDFVIFPPRWMVAEHTFRPPWYHRNVMSEFMGLIHGQYDAKAEGFLPGGASLHNCMIGHGPDASTFEAASKADLNPVYQGNTLAFMFEARLVYHPTAYAMQAPQRDRDYGQCWQDLTKHFKK
ncbi:MAG: homogentisate 1,2-dioxygenase [Alphaproteobacteria bacterium]|nr:homogentisate 1,2-dioxygenase [Alphaproteobacteria bacterium]MBV8547924.1 homogentisate 1,2-dioxygenase [Alphaproteobacteria bacterium]